MILAGLPAAIHFSTQARRKESDPGFALAGLVVAILTIAVLIFLLAAPFLS